MPITPYYERIVNDIRSQIESGELAPGAKLPSIAELCARYEVSTQVIRSAMLILRSEGLVEGHQGKGVYVRDRGADGGSG